MINKYISEDINKRIKLLSNYILIQSKYNKKIIILVKVYSGNATQYNYNYDVIK